MAERRSSPVTVRGASVAVQTPASNYPPVFAARVASREKRRLGDVFGLTNFGVNLTRLKPGGISALRHAHAKQDELVYVLEGTPTLVTDAGRTPMQPGDCAGFKAGTGDAHHLLNETDADVVYLEIGDRTPGESVVYPDDDVALVVVDGKMVFRHKDGTPY